MQNAYPNRYPKDYTGHDRTQKEADTKHHFHTTTGINKHHIKGLKKRARGRNKKHSTTPIPLEKQEGRGEGSKKQKNKREKEITQR